MGWNYTVTRMYGYVIDFSFRASFEQQAATGKDVVVDILSKHNLDYTMLLDKTTIMIHFVLQVTDSDYGSYTSRRPDTRGDEFNPPRHPMYEKTLDIPAPMLLNEYLEAEKEIKSRCSVLQGPIWIEIARVDW
jgi:hypothetical protein